MNIFLTGGTGFIGSYVAMELLKHNHHVTILARNKNKISALHDLENVTIVEGSIENRELMQECVQNKDVVIHIAVNYKPQLGWQVLQDDTLPTVFLADVAAQAGVKHFIYTSSGSANDSLYMVPPHLQEEPTEVVYDHTKQHPATYYGATKAACENFLIANSYLTDMRVNIIRPGYTFGNPVIEGAPTQSDTRFQDIVKSALKNEPITVTQYDGTQFIWAGDLAKLYTSVLNSELNHKTFFGLAKRLIYWSDIAAETIKRTNSKSKLIIEDKGIQPPGLIWDVRGIKQTFGLQFDGWDKILEHIDYYTAKIYK